MNSVLLTLGTGADTVYVRPNATAALNIRGGNPGAAPGDRLNLATAGVTNPVFSGNAANGNLTSSNFSRVDYSSFEAGPTVDDIAPAGLTATANVNGAPPTGGGLNRFAIDMTFNDNVAGILSGSSISVLDLQTELPIPSTSIAAEYITAGNTARFTFPGYANGALPDGNYLATVAGNLTDLFGNPLSAIPSVSFFSLGGDANRDRTVDIGDFSVLAARFNQPGTFTQGDFNYNGTTEIGDFSILASRFNSTLPAPSSLPTIGGGAATGVRFEHSAAPMAKADPTRTLFGTLSATKIDRSEILA